MSRVHTSFDRLDLNLLRVFDAVFRERHLTRAAQALALTPSAVSHAVRRLRDHVGEPLFVREGRSMLPTASCRRMAPQVLEHLAELRQLVDHWGRFDPASSNQAFRIGMPEAVEPMLLPGIQRAFAGTASNASLSSVGFERRGIARALASRQLDLVVDVALPVTEPVRHRPLLEDRFCVVVRADHPLGRRPTLAQYLAVRHVAVSTRAEGAVLEDSALLRLGVRREIAVRCQTYAAAFALVGQSDAAVTAPTLVAAQAGSSPALRRLPLPFEVPPVQLHLYWHANGEADPANTWLRSAVESGISATHPPVKARAVSPRRAGRDVRHHGRRPRGPHP